MGLLLEHERQMLRREAVSSENVAAFMDLRLFLN